MIKLKDNFDSKSLLENVDGWIMTLLKDKLKEDQAWQKLAVLCLDGEGQEVFREADMVQFRRNENPGAAFVDELVKRSVTLEYLVNLLKMADMSDILRHFRKEERVEIHSQSDEGLVYVELGEKIEMTVKASGFPPPTFLWYKRETPLLHHSSHVLSLDKFTIEDEGIYLCLVRQELQNDTLSLWSLPVQLCAREAPPSFLTQPVHIKLIEGEKLKLTCHVTGHPQPKFSWYRDGEKLRGGSEDPDLVIDAIRPSDAGSYSCVAANDVGESASEPALVQVAPTFNASPVPEIIHHPTLNEERRSIGQSFSLFCTAKCSQNVTFTWVVNGKPLEEASSHRHFVMTSATTPDYRTNLVFTVGEEDGSVVKVVCLVASSHAKRVSNPVQLKVVSKGEPNEYVAGSKWAFLIANTNYIGPSLSPLFTPARDMMRVAKELTQLNFNCLLLTDLNCEELKNSVKLFSSFIQPGDYVVFCYAGHGKHSGVDLLIPVPDPRSQAGSEPVSSVMVRKVLQRNNPALIFIVLDMCRHIHVPHGGPPIGLEGNQIRDPSERNYVILNATSEGLQAMENPKKSSILTRFLLKHIRDKVDLVAMAGAVLRDIAHVPPDVRVEQIPKLESTLCYSRSLTDPEFTTNRDKKQLWASLFELPLDRVETVSVEGCEIDVKVKCTYPTYPSSVVWNVMHITVEVKYRGQLPLPPMTVAFNVENDVKLISKTNNTHVYEVRALQKLKEQLVLTAWFRSSDGCKKQVEFALRMPGVAKVRLNDKATFDPVVRIRNPSYNIP